MIRTYYVKGSTLPYGVDVIENGLIVNSALFLFKLSQKIKVYLEQAKKANNAELVNKYSRLLMKARKCECLALNVKWFGG